MRTKRPATARVAVVEPGLFFGLAAAALVVLVAYARWRAARRCPYRRSLVSREASVCRGCGRELG